MAKRLSEEGGIKARGALTELFSPLSRRAFTRCDLEPALSLGGHGARYLAQWRASASALRRALFAFLGPNPCPRGLGIARRSASEEFNMSTRSHSRNKGEEQEKRGKGTLRSHFIMTPIKPSNSYSYEEDP